MILKLTRAINREVRSNCTIIKICANVCVRYWYSRAIQNVLSLSFSLSTIVLSLSFHF